MGTFAARLTGLVLLVVAIVLTGTAAAERKAAQLTPIEARIVARKAPPVVDMARSKASLLPTVPSPPMLATPQSGSYGGGLGSALARRLRDQQGAEKREAFREVNRVLDELLQEQDSAQVGIVVQPLNGNAVYTRDAQQFFPLASVAKLYMLVAYLNRLEQEQRAPDEDEIDLLQAMIEISDNDSAEEIWTALGGFDAMQVYLSSAGLQQLAPPVLQQLLGGSDLEPEAWGDAAQTPGNLAVFLQRLRNQRLLNPENTLLATALLGQIVDAQTWGINAGIDELDPGSRVLFKNGWYPGDEGWRINTAGIVLPGDGKQPYVLVILGQGFDDWEDGIATIEQAALMINRVMLGR